MSFSYEHLHWLWVKHTLTCLSIFTIYVQLYIVCERRHTWYIHTSIGRDSFQVQTTKIITFDFCFSLSVQCVFHLIYAATTTHERKKWKTKKKSAFPSTTKQQTSNKQRQRKKKLQKKKHWKREISSVRALWKWYVVCACAVVECRPVTWKKTV